MKPRLLVIELHHLGDAVLAIPFLRAAQESHEIRVFCAPGTADLLAEFVQGVTALPAAPRWAGRFHQAATELRAWHPDLTVSAWSDARAGIAAVLSGAPRRVGFPMTPGNYYAAEIPWRRRRLKTGQMMETVARIAGIPLINEPLHRGSRSESHLQNWHRIAGHLGIPFSLTPPWIAGEMELPEAARQFVEAQKSAGRRLWILHGGGRLPTKRWPVDRFQELLKTFFADSGRPVLIVGSPGEPCPEPVGPLQLRLICTSHRMLAAALASADAVLCNDSYPAHLAAALGKTVYPIFGSGEPDWFAPWENRQNVIRKAVCPHHPCIDRCVMPSIVCLDAITPADVAERLQTKEEKPGS